jgi:hypothetical protein
MAQRVIIRDERLSIAWVGSKDSLIAIGSKYAGLNLLLTIPLERRCRAVESRDAVAGVVIFVEERVVKNNRNGP